MSPQDAPAAPVAEILAALRADGAEGFDPIGLHAIEALARRAQTAPEEVQRLLEPRLRSKLAQLRACPPRVDASAALAGSGRTLLGALNARLHEIGTAAPVLPFGSDARPAPDAGAAPPPAGSLAAVAAGTGDTRGTGTAPELRSLRRFRQAWARISAEERLRRALGRAPLNAGPLNSHMLVLRALATTQQLSPDYLQRILDQFDTLLWLETRQQAAAPAGTKPPRRARARK